MADSARASVPMDVTLETIIKTVKEILDTKQEAQFIAQFGKMTVIAQPDVVNFVKDFLDQHPPAGPMAATADSVRNSPSGSCFPHPRG